MTARAVRLDALTAELRAARAPVPDAALPALADLVARIIDREVSAAVDQAAGRRPLPMRTRPHGGGHR